MAPDFMCRVTPDAWRALVGRRIFFGHRSLGRNLLDGIEHLVAKQDAPVLSIYRNQSPVVSSSPGLYELDIGTNRMPATKDAAFAKVLADGFGDEPGAIAMQKYCYVDVGPDTDPVKLFNQYSAHVGRLRERHPGLTLVHFTIPLQSAPRSMSETITGWFGAPTRLSLNARREQFNEMVRGRFGGREPVFDIAAIQSLRGDGHRERRRYRGEAVAAMAPEWTYDGGHLNDAGREWVAAHFLALLATLG